MTLSRLTRTALPACSDSIESLCGVTTSRHDPRLQWLEDKIKENVVAAASDEPSSSSQVSLKKLLLSPGLRLKKNGSATERAETQEESTRIN